MGGFLQSYLSNIRVKKADYWVDPRLGFYRVAMVEKLDGWDDESAGNMAEETNLKF